MMNSSKPRHYLQIPDIYNLASTKVSNSKYTSRLPHSRTMRNAVDKCDTMGWRVIIVTPCSNVLDVSGRFQ